MNAVLQSLINAATICIFFAIIKLTQCANNFAELDMVTYCIDQRTLCQNTGSFIHIVCQYYGKTGSSCSRFSEVPLDDSSEDEILQRINTMRAQAASGKTIGKGQQRLPRAYGLKKVLWDSELAAFAKIMINQCISRHRYSCAASKSFTSPMMAYTFANTTSSASAIIDNIFSSWEADALTTTPDEILHSPDLKGGEPRFYIKMVAGEVTHVGCAAGVYEHEIRPIAFTANDNIRLSGHIVCYLSHYSREGTPIYNTTPPIRGMGWTKCGCPPMYRETRDCLCVPSTASEHIINQPVAIREMMNTTATSTQESYDHLEQYMQYIYNIVSPPVIESAEKTQLLDLTTEKQLELTPQQNLEWSPIETLDQQMQQELEPTIQEKQKETQLAPVLRAGVGTPAPTCTTGVRCEPKIVMLPIFTIENAPKLISRRRPRGYNRRSSNTSSVPNTKEIDDISFSDENYDELPQNTSMRSKVLKKVNKIRKKQAINIFSDENAEHGQPNKERSQINVETTKESIDSGNSTTNKPSHADTKKSVMNLLELIEEQEKIVQTNKTSQKSYDDRNEKAKKRVMHLLDLLEEKGGKAQLNSREMVEFDAKMRRIYVSVVGTTHNEDNFIKLWNIKP